MIEIFYCRSEWTASWRSASNAPNRLPATLLPHDQKTQSTFSASELFELSVQVSEAFDSPVVAEPRNQRRVEPNLQVGTDNRTSRRTALRLEQGAINVAGILPWPYIDCNQSFLSAFFITVTSLSRRRTVNAFQRSSLLAQADFSKIEQNWVNWNTLSMYAVVWMDGRGCARLSACVFTLLGIY